MRAAAARVGDEFRVGIGVPQRPLPFDRAIGVEDLQPVPQRPRQVDRPAQAFRRLGLAPTVLRAPELGGDVSFSISPRRPELRQEINMALERIKRNGAYDRINSRFLPFRVS